MKYYLIAGEASGDLHASNLMRELKRIDNKAQFRFFGGDLMQAQGGTLVKHCREMAYMGFVEVLVNLPSIFQNLKECKTDLLANRPDVLILVDFPGFNLKIANFAKKNGIKVFYYIAPKAWAWNKKRVHQIKKYVDKLFCILPFEVEFFAEHGIHAHYVGNPLQDAIANHTYLPDFLNKNNLSDKPIVALLPGSRKQELKRILPVMLATVPKFPEYQFVIAGAPNFKAEQYQELGSNNIPVLFGQTYDLLKNAQAAIVTSGTATLETALLNVPQVVVYKANALSVAIARKLVTIKFISLVNLIMDKKVVEELIQEECNPFKIEEELHKILEDETYKNQMLQHYTTLATLVGEAGASERAAELISNDNN